MSDENRSVESIIANVVVPLIGLAVTYWVGTHAASIEIEIRSRLKRAQMMLDAIREGQSAGQRVAEWWIKAEAPRVIAEAEAITKGESE